MLMLTGRDHKLTPLLPCLYGLLATKSGTWYRPHEAHFFFPVKHTNTSSWYAAITPVISHRYSSYPVAVRRDFSRGISP